MTIEEGTARMLDRRAGHEMDRLQQFPERTMPARATENITQTPAACLIDGRLRIRARR
jgi:hypothetical protein